uniref:Uncharacterized protein n=1 Tax=Moniliophthora roreri TaxID=221103 RepID=A0A0W0FNZ3_MONRR
MTTLLSTIMYEPDFRPVTSKTNNFEFVAVRNTQVSSDPTQRSTEDVELFL